MRFKSIEEAENVRQDLVDRIMSIDVQLGERAAKFSVGKSSDADYKAYLEWKSRACKSKASMISKLSRVKREIRELREIGARQRILDSGAADGLLRGLYGLSKSLVSAGADITKEEQMLLDDVQFYLEQGMR
jgi:hypothetical protein